ncbi:MAG: phosphoadenylyl-sulfate reductase [Alphaproteobacteria bacterium]
MTTVPAHHADKSESHATDLNRIFGELPAVDLLSAMIREEFPGRIALASSFGAESTILLHMVARIDPSTPVLFLDTGKLFGETRRYRRELAVRFRLTDVRDITPDTDDIDARDRDGVLWRDQPDSCCYLRKVLPLRRTLGNFDAWINGRKRVQGGQRIDMNRIEEFEGRIKINPLADWGLSETAAYFDRFDLPRHPLIADGYTSIGCMPCTAPPGDSDDYRDGRWAGQSKTECGIHIAHTQG